VAVRLRWFAARFSGRGGRAREPDGQAAAQTPSRMVGSRLECSMSLFRDVMMTLGTDWERHNIGLRRWSELARGIIPETIELWPNLGDGGLREAAYRGG